MYKLQIHQSAPVIQRHEEEQITAGLLTVAHFPVCHPQQMGQSSQRAGVV